MLVTPDFSDVKIRDGVPTKPIKAELIPGSKKGGDGVVSLGSSGRPSFPKGQKELSQSDTCVVNRFIAGGSAASCSRGGAAAYGGIIC